MDVGGFEPPCLTSFQSTFYVRISFFYNEQNIKFFKHANQRVYRNYVELTPCPTKGEIVYRLLNGLVRLGYATSA